MSLKIKLDVENACKKENVTCHMLPCGIKLNGFCKVSKYFSPYIRDDGNTLTNSIRGHPLHGQTVKVPDGYSGIILKEMKDCASEDKELRAIGSFNEFTAWNWDKKPSEDDKLIKAMEWINVASILHKPVTEYDSVESKEDSEKSRKRKLSE